MTPLEKHGVLKRVIFFSIRPDNTSEPKEMSENPFVNLIFEVLYVFPKDLLENVSLRCVRLLSSKEMIL